MKSLKQKIILPVIVVVLIGFITLTIVGYFQARQIAVHYVQLVAQNKVEKLQYIVNNNLEKWKLEIIMLSAVQPVKNMDSAGMKEYIASNSDSFTNYENIFIADKKGNFIGINNKKGNISDREYFHQVMNGQIAISQPIVARSTGDESIVVAAPVQDEQKNTIGLVGGTIKLARITDIINSETLGHDGYAYMISNSGLLIAHPKKEFILKKNFLKDTTDSHIKVTQEMVRGKSGIGYYEFEGKNKIIAYAPISSMGWSIGMTAYDHEINEDIAILRNYILLVGFIIVMIIGGLLYFISDTLIKPINRLKEYMEIASRGNLTIYSDIDQQDEIGVLSNKFNILLKENKRLLEEIKQHDQYRAEFFSNISHELRTPLNIIFSAIQLIDLYTAQDEKSIDPAKLKKHTFLIKQNSYRLLRLVNNLIDITRIDSGFIKLNLENKNIVEIIENITLSTVEYVQSKSREIIFDTEVEEKIMSCDPEQIERIMLNLISNAVKFTNPGDLIEVNIYDQGEKIQISVKDSGIGISEEKQTLIFERFKQANPLYNREKEGSGIGLALVKELVEMHRGTISVKSILGQGSEFIIAFPVTLASEKQDEAAENNFITKSQIEKINIEFSDIYE